MADIRHEGRVLRIGKDETVVEIVSQSACSACHAAGICSMSEAKRKEITVPTSQVQGAMEGEIVDVSLRRTMGNKAVLLAYVLPLIVLMAAVLLLPFAGAGELATGLGSIGCVGIYYFVLWLFRNSLRNEGAFFVTRKQTTI